MFDSTPALVVGDACGIEPRRTCQSRETAWYRAARGKSHGSTLNVSAETIKLMVSIPVSEIDGPFCDWNNCSRECRRGSRWGLTRPWLCDGNGEVANSFSGALLLSPKLGNQDLQLIMREVVNREKHDADSLF